MTDKIKEVALYLATEDYPNRSDSELKVLAKTTPYPERAKEICQLFEPKSIPSDISAKTMHKAQELQFGFEPKPDEMTMSMNITEMTTRACQEPTLLEALTFICVWESERVVKQARTNNTWDTCFKVRLEAVLDNYKPKPDEGLAEFFGLHHAELDAIMMNVLGQVASMYLQGNISGAGDLYEGRLLTDEELVEECMPALERFEVVEKQVFYPIPKSTEFSATIRIYASTMSREAVRKTLVKTASIKDAECQERVERILDGIENPPYHQFNAVTKFERTAGFNEAIQAIKQALKKKEGVK